MDEIKNQQNFCKKAKLSFYIKLEIKKIRTKLKKIIYIKLKLMEEIENKNFF